MEGRIKWITGQPLLIADSARFWKRKKKTWKVSPGEGLKETKSRQKYFNTKAAKKKVSKYPKSNLRNTYNQPAKVPIASSNSSAAIG